MTVPLPTGTVTFLFTDLEGSTQLWERHPAAMPAALARHDALLRAAVESYHGTIIKTTGDGLHAVFASAADAAGAVLAAQRALQVEPWPATGPLRVRMALHTGEADLRDGDYYGPALNRAARLMAAASGGQSLISQATAAVLQDRLPPQAGLRDLGEHSLKDLLRPERVFQIEAPDLPTKFPPLRTGKRVPHNLPGPVTSFIGRERELAEAQRLLANTHLLTLTGPGGTGKTRLSLQLAAEVLDGFADGVWLVELAALADPALLAQTVAATWAVREQPGRPLIDTLTDYVRPKILLLILDNCEHLLDACAQLASALLPACPHLKLLTSSREALGVAGETAYRVPSLTLPDIHQPMIPAEAAACEAVRLFVARAQAVQPAFALTATNLPAIAKVCWRLDGIPLALELAAARVKVLSVEQIAERLDDRFRLLTGGSRTALPRQQTLRALIDWSYDLLPPAECAALARLSVFAGGWTLEAAEALLGPEALDLLAHLVDKSLVVVEDAPAGQAPRYRLLETIRQYARDKLLETGEAETVRDQHLDYFVQLSEAAEPRLKGAEMLAALDELQAEQDNLRAALEWALDRTHTTPLAAARLMGVLWIFFARRASSAEGRRWVQAVLAGAKAATRAPGPDDLAAYARVLVAEGSLGLQMGDTPAALAAARESIEVARQIGATRTLALALGLAATISGMLGEVTLGRAWAAESLVLCRQHGYGFELGMYSGSHLFLAMVAQQGVAPDLRAEMLQTARATGNPWAIALAVQNVARIAAMAGEYEAAYQGFEETLGLYQQIGDRHFANSSRSEMAHVRRKQGRAAEATAIYGETIRVWCELGQSPALAHELECLAFIATATAQAERAARLFGAAEALREQLGAPMTAIEHREYEANLATLRAQLDPAAREAAWAAGRGLNLDAAIAYALEAGPGESG